MPRPSLTVKPDKSPVLPDYERGRFVLVRTPHHGKTFATYEAGMAFYRKKKHEEEQKQKAAAQEVRATGLIPAIDSTSQGWQGELDL